MTASNTTDSTAFDITDWLGEWESFEHYIDSDDAAIQQTWEAAEQAVLANPKMAPMAARGIRTFWSMACSTTSPENIIHIGYWRVNEPAAESGSTDDAALAIEWFAEDDTSLDTYEYTIDHVAEGGLLSHLHFQYANDLHTLVATDEATGTETLRNPRWYATMCANEGTVEDRCAIIRALHHLQ